MTTARPICRARRTPRLRGGRDPKLRPGLTDPVQKWLTALHVRRTLMTWPEPNRPPRRRPMPIGQRVWDSQPMGEFELLAKLRERLPPPGSRVRVGSGDDAAVTVPGGATATSVDAVVDGVHFRREQATLAQIGHKALATALSDLAAMGAEAGEAYVVLGAPPDLAEAGLPRADRRDRRPRRRDRHDACRRRRHPGAGADPGRHRRRPRGHGGAAGRPRRRPAWRHPGPDRGARRRRGRPAAAGRPAAGGEPARERRRSACAGASSSRSRDWRRGGPWRARGPGR